MFFHSISAVAGSLDRPPIHPAPRRSGRDCGDALLKVLGYVGALALLAAIALTTAKPFVTLLGSAVAAPPALAGSDPQSLSKTAGYDGQNRPDGRDQADAGQTPRAEPRCATCSEATDPATTSGNWGAGAQPLPLRGSL